jgi:hypothetical protein
MQQLSQIQRVCLADLCDLAMPGEISRSDIEMQRDVMAHRLSPARVMGPPFCHGHGTRLFPVAGREVMVAYEGAAGQSDSVGGAVRTGSGFLALPVGLAFDDEFVGGRLQPVHRGLGQQWIGHHGQDLGGFSVAGDVGGGLAVAFDDELVEVAGLVASSRCNARSSMMSISTRCSLGISSS